jgi:hypothetical protein
VFYQLRRLWQAGRELLTAFVADLARQQDERERRAHLAQHNRQQFARRQAAEAQLAVAQAQHSAASEQLTELERQRADLTRFWHYFKRRACERRILAAQTALEGAKAALTETQNAVDDISREALPEFSGLSLQARRAINLAAIAYAEVLCLRLTELKTPLVQLARTAIAQREAGDDYGSPKECVVLMGHIARAHKLIAGRAELATELRTRTERLKGVAQYRGAADSAPLADSIALSEGDVLASGPLGNTAMRLPNVLADDVWDLFRVLLR